MDSVQIVLGILLLVSAVFLVVAVLMQNGSKHGLSGAISGGAETYFGKQKGSTIEKRLSKLTIVVAIIFVVIVLVMYVMQDQYDLLGSSNAGTTAAETTSVADGTGTSEPEAIGTDAPSTDAGTEVPDVGTDAPEVGTDAG